jgi:DNA-binding NarL/FixJ family response regulator
VRGAGVSLFGLLTPNVRLAVLCIREMRVVLAEDSLLLRAGVARLLQDEGFEVVGQAGDLDDLLRKVRAHKPDVAIVDIKMPPTHTDEGLKAAAIIRSELPGTGVLVLSQYVEKEYAAELLAESAEGVGYLLKDRVADLERFIDAVRRVAEGGSVLDPEVVSRMLARRSDPLDQLTPREREVLVLMAEGRSNSSIATELVVTERAVEKHVTSIFSKLDLPATAEGHRRVLAVLAYLNS